MMTPLCKNCALLLLFLTTFLPPFTSHVFTEAATTAPSVTRHRILFMTAGPSDDDEDEDEDEDFNYPSIEKETIRTFVHGEPQLCLYNPCLENQPPCATLSQQTGCLCPGFSGASEPPHAPRIQDLLPVKEGPDSGKVEVQWCAPSSVVSGYRVTVEGNGKSLDFKDNFRKGVLGYLDVGTKVCVEAVNNAGRSDQSEFSCKRYEPPATSDHNLIIGVLVGAAIFLLLLVIGAVVCWRYRTCQKGKQDSNDGL